jgi:predicted ATPase
LKRCPRITLRSINERCGQQGIYTFDEPELSLSRQIEFPKLLRRMKQSTICQLMMATHSPILMFLRPCPAV